MPEQPPTADLPAPPTADALTGTVRESVAAAADTVQAAAAQTAETVQAAGAQAAAAVETAQRVAERETLPEPVVVERGRSALYASLLAFAGFLGIFLLVRANRSGGFDTGVTMKLQALRHPVLARVMWLVSWPGFPPQGR